MASLTDAEAARLASRPLRYEISIRRDGRWQIVEVVTDGREKLNRPFDRRDLEIVETRVRNIANEYVAKPGTEAVRVVQQRLRADGDYSETIIIEKQAERRGETPVGGLGRLTTAPPMCETADDLLGRPACRAIGVLLGRLCVEVNGSPLEFLCDDGWSRRLDKYEALIASAVRAVASLQVNGPVVRARADALERIIDSARKRRRAAFKAPELVPSKQFESGYAPGELDRFLGTLTGSPEERRFLALRAVCRAMPATTHWEGKVITVLALPGASGSTEAWSLVDEFVAGYLINAKYVMEILGERPDLASAIEALASLCVGVSPDKRFGAVATPLAEGIKAGRLPLCREELVDRVLSTWASSRPLTKGRFSDELEALKLIQGKLSQMLPSVARKIGEIGERRKSELWQRDDVN